MAAVVVSETAVEDVERLIEANTLPPDTRERLARSLRVLEAFPLAGRELVGDWSGFRFWIGPWPWMISVYEYLPGDDVALVVAVHDGRASAAATRDR